MDLFKPLIGMYKVPTYTLKEEEIEAAVYNWLDQSGGHILCMYPEREPFVHIENNKVVIYFEEDYQI
jgi:hypothetical protein